MKKNQNQVGQSKLLRKANKMLVWGTMLKILLPGTGIGSLLSTSAWVLVADDVYHNPENYPAFDSDSYRMIAGKLPKDVECGLTESSEMLKKEITKFVASTKAKIDQIHNGEESQ